MARAADEPATRTAGHAPARRPTIADVARAAGVSKGAVSFALNGRPGVAPGTRDRILATAGELGWSPSHRARALSSSRSLAVGLVLARSPETLGSDPFFPAFIAGVETVLSPAGQALVLQVVPDPAAELAGYRTLAAEGRVDGVLLTDVRVGDERPALLREIGLPAVVVAPSALPGWDGVPAVPADDRPGVAEAVEHLIALGHTRIAHVGGRDDLVHARSRREAWQSSLAAHHLPAGPCAEADFSAASGAAATARLLELPDPPTAVLYANDLMAVAGLSVAHGRGVRVPHDLSVVGFDDTELAAHLTPALTTVRADAAAWGRAAAERLLELVAHPDDVADAPPLPPPRLVVRGSTAPPAG
ncbi:LacI family DNA-binding transcriptional regulator [Angustibacter aerolatus]